MTNSKLTSVDSSAFRLAPPLSFFSSMTRAPSSSSLLPSASAFSKLTVSSAAGSLSFFDDYRPRFKVERKQSKPGVGPSRADTKFSMSLRGKHGVYFELKRILPGSYIHEDLYGNILHLRQVLCFLANKNMFIVFVCIPVIAPWGHLFPVTIQQVSLFWPVIVVSPSWPNKCVDEAVSLPKSDLLSLLVLFNYSKHNFLTDISWGAQHNVHYSQ